MGIVYWNNEDGSTGIISQKSISYLSSGPGMIPLFIKRSRAFLSFVTPTINPSANPDNTKPIATKMNEAIILELPYFVIRQDQKYMSISSCLNNGFVGSLLLPNIRLYRDNFGEQRSYH